MCQFRQVAGLFMRQGITRSHGPLCTDGSITKDQDRVKTELDPNTQKGSKERYLLGLKTKHANFRGNPLYEATKRHLNNS